MQERLEERVIEPVAHKVPDAAKRLGMSERYLWDKIRQREISVVKTGRYLRITNKQIEQFLEANTVQAEDMESFAKKLVAKRKN
ncbi:MAG: helix-turn-helix domain-containing protein [Candidatus Obscuribacterales bacterium]